MRILITGSRTWSDVETVRKALNDAVAGIPVSDITVVHGACPLGADALADHLASKAGVTVERYPAAWDELGKKAGFVRNEEMVNLGADVCLAFIRAGSSGASHTARLAEVAGIKTVRYEM